MNISDDIITLKGIGEKAKTELNKCGVFTIYDLMLYFPRTYENIERVKSIDEVEEGEKVVLMGRLKSLNQRKSGYKTITHGVLEGDGGTFEVYWFNVTYIRNVYKVGNTYILMGKAKFLRGKVTLSNPTIFKGEDNKKNIMPVYPLKGSLKNSYMIKTIKGLLETVSVEENLPERIIKKFNFCSLDEALKNIHFPESSESLKEATRRLKFQELFSYSLKVLMLKDYINNNKKGIKFNITKELSDLKEQLPFTLTSAQSRAVREILKDEKKDTAMNRLLQGDVGSGKTVVAAIAVFNVVINGYQGCVMAPTEILATQHYEEFKKLFANFNLNIELLVGSRTLKEKRDIKERLYNGEIDILIGTHALIEDDVEFKKLGIIVADEQHRFGVAQRNKLYSKENKADILVMTATPIPRTLSLYIYGDLDVSVIDELPPGRKKIDTKFIDSNRKYKVYEFLKQQLEEGRQGYVVCPLIEEDKDGDLTSVEKLYKELKEDYFKEEPIEILHGKMKPKEKDDIMNRFKNKEIKILISTTVIEVGINVPNSNVMIIENCERFGLSQLHQLRGRVGRGEYKSYCFLVGNCKSEKTRRRMAIMEESNDGFYISQEDLKLRGTGDLFGFRQSGEDGLILSDIFEDFDLLRDANNEAKVLLNSKEEEDIRIKDEMILRLESYDEYISFN
ncbi:ATP-dependent DNA helicase RecG [Clostridium bornimense]|uniref:ATP-dependent DNA helicase RecG n=1 Tax=Clostridium bornimense TaxID=1216932 RepID=W6S415_9CLOT|nr:ATP-dependent DNA helicase RecG [Clostridium bornimense]CDM69067.1 ATP-dependent DNA helicase RecG [Clostridium bornimense]